MGLFDYALNSFSPYQGGLLGALGANDMAALARSYGGYSTPEAQQQNAPQSNIQQPNIGPMIRPGSVLDSISSMFSPGPFSNSWQGFQTPSPYDEGGFSGAFPNAQQPTQQNVPMPPPRPPGLGQSPQPPQPAPQFPAQLPPHAQPIQGQAPPQMQPQMQPSQQQGGGFLQGLSNFSHNLGSAPGIPGLIDAIRGTQTGQRYDAAGKAEQNQAQMAQALYGALTQRGMPHQQAVGIAMAASTDSKMAEHLLPEALGLKPPATVEGVIASDMYRNKGGQTGGDLNSNQLLKQWDERTARLAGQKTAAEETAKIQAPAKLALGPAIAAADEQIRLVESLRNHPGRQGAFAPTGLLGKVPAIPGTEGYDFTNRLDQVKSGAFLQAFESLKGAGAITEVEGAKATSALARMDRSTTTKEFDSALNDYLGVIKRGKDKAAIMAGNPAPQMSAPQPRAQNFPAPPSGFRVLQ